MKNLLFILLAAFSLQCQAQLIEGYNLGQMHHFAQGEWRNEGYVPMSAVNLMRDQTPVNYRKYARMSGTMSNSWALDLTGFQHAAHDRQIANQQNMWRGVPQPTQSYGYAFIQFFKDFGFDSLVWTLNTHSPYIAGELPTGDGIWMQRLWRFLDAIDSAGIPISHICLDNEWWMDNRVCGVSAGTPNAGDKSRHTGAPLLLAAFIPANRIEAPVKAEMHRFVKWLEDLVPLLRKRYPNATILMTVDHPTQHLRGRWMWDVVRSYSFYDGITPHLYPDVKNKSALTKWIDDRLKPFGNVPIYVTEWNFHHDSGTPYNGFYADFIQHLKGYRSVKMAMRHTLWAGDQNGFSAVRLR